MVQPALNAVLLGSSCCNLSSDSSCSLKKGSSISFSARLVDYYHSGQSLSHCANVRFAIGCCAILDSEPRGKP